MQTRKRSVRRTWSGWWTEVDLKSFELRVDGPLVDEVAWENMVRALHVFEKRSRRNHGPQT